MNLDIYSAVLYCTAIGLERIFPRNPYKVLSSENKNALMLLPFRLFCIWLMTSFYFSVSEKYSYFSFSIREELPFWAQLGLFLFFSDFAIYIIHRLQHRLNFYWQWHKLHHATTELSAISNLRSNIIELAVVQYGSRILVAHILGLSEDALTIGVIIFMTISGPFDHANINFPTKKWRWLNYVFVTPNFHARHHSLKSSNCNFGESFTIFDLIFGTFQMPEEKNSEFGIPDAAFLKMNLLEQHLYPLKSFVKLGPKPGASALAASDEPPKSDP